MFASELFDECEFPATAEELLEAIHGEELDLPNGSESVASAIERGGGDTFQTREDAELAVHNGVSEAAIGRKGYSDRDPTTPGTEGHPELSF